MPESPSAGRRSASFQPSPQGRGRTFQRSAKGRRPGSLACPRRLGMSRTERVAILPMSQSLSHILLHLVWSTKDRRPTIPENLRPNLHVDPAEVARDTGAKCPRVGGTSGHVHLAIILSRTQTIASLVDHLNSHARAGWLDERTGLRRLRPAKRLRLLHLSHVSRRLRKQLVKPFCLSTKC